LPPASLPRLIGKNGSNINNLRTTTGARISVEDNSTGRVTINGPAEAVIKAKEALATFSREWSAEKDSAEVAVPDRLMRVIIGKGGAGVRAIQEQCMGVRIDCDRTAGVVRIR
ncbi:hypothetical protein JKP88DRAFT_144673, partial [Tribonema minus]